MRRVSRRPRAEVASSDPAVKVTSAALAVLLVISVIGGGSSQEPGGSLVAVMLALPCIAWATFRLMRTGPDLATSAWLALAVVLVALPVAQLLSMPAALAASAGRTALAADLTAFGVAMPTRWSLAPQATRVAMFAMLPPVALFLLCLALPGPLQRRVVPLLLALALASLVLGIVQLGAPQESVLNPFPQWQPALGGFFASPNHQATLLVVAAVFAAATLGAALRARMAGERAHAAPALGAAFMLLLTLVALPLTGSRAGVVIVVVACAAVVALQWSAGGGAARRWLVLGASLLVLAGSWAAAGWMQVDAVDEIRAPLRHATTHIAAQFAPLGSGVGSFVPMFEQHAPEVFIGEAYVNHAHNEYLQWWLEAGVPALLAMLLAALARAASARALWQLPPHARDTGVAAIVALLAVLAHSVVDYPLRTPALLAVAAVLAGLVAGQGWTRRAAGTHVAFRAGESGHTPGQATDARVSMPRLPVPAHQG